MVAEEKIFDVEDEEAEEDEEDEDEEEEVSLRWTERLLCFF